MSFPGYALTNIIQVSLGVRSREPFRFRLAPGDWACIDSSCPADGDIPLQGLTIDEALEKEAFTGKSGNQVTGWVRKGEVLLVIAVKDELAFVWGPGGRGWLDRQFVCSIFDYAPPATIDVYKKVLLGAV